MTEPFDRVEMKSELLRRIGEVIGKGIPSDGKYPSIRLSELGEGDKASRLVKVLDWIVRETRASA
jgi:hypothetical protein